MKNTKIILDTDIGYDPDDLFALLFLQKLVKNEDIAVITTANECNGKRVDFLYEVLQEIDLHPSIGRGASLGLDKFTVDTLLTNKFMRPVDPENTFLSHMKGVTMSPFNSSIYIGLGGFTNLAKFIEASPDEAKKMKIFLMGGAINYERYHGWFEYNVKIDPVSAEKVINADLDITLIMAQTTHNPLYEVTQNSSLYKKLKQSTLPIHKLLCDHCDLWFQKREFKHGTSMHDPLTVATALGYDFVGLHQAKVSIKNGKFVLDQNGHEIKYSATNSKAQEFMDFLEETLLK